MKSSRPIIEPQFFDLAGASAYMGGAVSVRQLRRLIAEPGGLPYHQVGGRGKIIIARADLDAFLMANRHEPLDLGAIADQALQELGAK